MHMPRSKDKQSTRESLRGGVAPLNGGSGGRHPQIRVLPPLGESLIASTIRLPIGLSLAFSHDPHSVGGASPPEETDVPLPYQS